MTNARTGTRPTWPVTSREARATSIQFQFRANGALPYNSATNFLDVSAYTFAAQVRAYAEDDVILATLGVVMTNAATGRVSFQLTEAQANAMPLGDHRWDVRWDPPGAESDQLIDVSDWSHRPVVTP